MRYIILDEVHNIANSRDGALWERIATFTDAPILALSATVGDPDGFHGWLSRVVACCPSAARQDTVAIIRHGGRRETAGAPAAGGRGGAGAQEALVIERWNDLALCVRACGYAFPVCGRPFDICVTCMRHVNGGRYNWDPNRKRLVRVHTISMLSGAALRELTGVVVRRAVRCDVM